VLRVRGQGGTVLLTGDIEANAEQSLLNTSLGGADIVVVPHHGSRTSSTDAFVRMLSPQIALFSAGYRNRWGLPKPDVVARWRRTGTRVLSTDRSGAIEIDVGGAGMKVREHRKVARRYWSRAPQALCENSDCRLDE
jgi:competence protein ComEC